MFFACTVVRGCGILSFPKAVPDLDRDTKVPRVMRSLFRPASCWVLCNFLGMAGYLFLASTLWVRPSEEGVPGGPGDGFYWLVCLAPVPVLFFGLHVEALFFVVRQVKRTGRKGTLAL